MLLVDQVWSLTQVFHVDFSQSRIRCEKVCIRKTRDQGFASAVFDGVLGPPRLAPHIGWRPCFQATCEARSRSLEGRRVSAQKALQGSEAETRELLGGTLENSVS